MDPEEMETALAAALRPQFPDYVVLESYRAQVPAGSIVVRFGGLDRNLQKNGGNPATARVSAGVGVVEMDVRFISARNAPRGVFAGVLAGCDSACRALTEERPETWATQQLAPPEYDGAAEDDCKQIEVTIEVDIQQ